MTTTNTVGSGKYTYTMDQDWAKLPEGWDMPAAVRVVISAHPTGAAAIQGLLSWIGIACSANRTGMLRMGIPTVMGSSRIGTKRGAASPVGSARWLHRLPGFGSSSLTWQRRTRPGTRTVRSSCCFPNHPRGWRIARGSLAKVLSFCPAFRHDILDFCVRELVTLSGGGVEKKMAIIVLLKRSWNHRKAT